MRSTTLARIRNAAYAFTSDTCDIYRPSLTIGRGGAPNEDLQPVALDVPCRFITIGKRYVSQADVVGGLESMHDSYRVSVHYDIDIRAGDEIKVAGQTFQVTAIEEDVTEAVWATALVSRRRS